MELPYTKGVQPESIFSKLKKQNIMCVPWMAHSRIGQERKPPVTPEVPSDELDKSGKRVPAVFFRTDAGGEPLRNWLKGLPLDEDRKRIGDNIKTVEFGWPIGMPDCRSRGDGIYEARTNLAKNRIGRIFFYIDEKSRIVLLHGSIKKTAKAPSET